LVFFDLETTGLSLRKGERVCEVAILRREPSGEERWLDTLVRSERPVSAGAFQANKISEEMLQGAPAFCDVASQVNEIMRGAVGIAHNATFDAGFLRREFERLQQLIVIPPCLDTLAMSRVFYTFPKNNLAAIAKHFNIEVKLSHRARADVETMRDVFDAMIKDLAAYQLQTPRQIQTRLKQLRRQKRRKKSADIQPIAAPSSQTLMHPMLAVG
jgi:DNA polymerase III epsilon subunit family exonuclease